MKKCISILAICACVASSAFAETKHTYSGIILSSRRSIDDRAFNFFMLRKEKLTSTSTHYVDGRSLGDEPQVYSRSTSLCRRAKVRRIQKASTAKVRCSPNFVLSILDEPNDLFFPQQYGMRLMSMPYTWNKQKGSSELLALVIDTGIDINHQDLKNNVWTNPNEIPNNKIDDDGNGFIDDVNGMNAITNVGSGIDDNGHGTHVAGIIGAETNNYFGVAGVAPNVKLVGLKFLSSSGLGSTANAIKSVNYGIQLKRAGYRVVVMNNSYGSSLFSKPFLDVIRAANREDILFVAAAGNSSKNTDLSPAYPASYDSSNIISVGSVDSSVIYNSWSNYGTASVDVAAPGATIYSTLPLNRYGYMGGTSMAAPHVSGLSILAKAQCSTIDANSIKSYMMSSVVKYPKLETKVASGGVVNGVGLIDTVIQNCGQNDPTPTPTSTPAGAISPTSTPTATATPTQTPTRTPTVTPTITPTETPTVATTETPIETPMVPPSVGFRSSILYPNQTLEFFVQGSPQNVANVQFQLKFSNGTFYSCPNTPVKLTNGQRTYRITLPKEIENFPSMNVLLKAPGLVTQSSYIIKAARSTTSRSIANITCFWLTRQLDW